MLAKLVALAVYEARTRLVDPVAAEYRKIGAAPECGRPHLSDQSYDVSSTTAVHLERASGWDHDRKRPAAAADRPPFGFVR